MQTIAYGMATGAKILKHIVRPNLLITGDPKYYRRPSKAISIKNVYLGKPSSLLHNRQNKPHAFAKDQHRPIRTTTENYFLRFNSADEPSYSVRTRPAKPNPFTDMAVTGYKHFEKTVLRELEQNEERRVEASMALPEKSVEQQLLDGTPFADWKPMPSPVMASVKLPPTEKPYPVSKLNTVTSGLTVKPVHEVVVEEPVKPSPNHIESILNKSRANKYLHRKPSKPSVVATVGPTTTTNAPAVTTTKSVLDIPNYPDFFIKQNNHLIANSKPRHFTKAMVDEKSTTERSKTYPHEQNIGSFSEHREVYADPGLGVTSRPPAPRRVHRHRARDPASISDTNTPTEKSTEGFSSISAKSSRGKVKFGDRADRE